MAHVSRTRCGLDVLQASHVAAFEQSASCSVGRRTETSKWEKRLCTIVQDSLLDADSQRLDAARHIAQRVVEKSVTATPVYAGFRTGPFPKLRVAGSSPVSRSGRNKRPRNTLGALPGLRDVMTG